MKIENMGSWQRTRNVLVSTLMVLNEAQGGVEFSEQPGSEFMKLEIELGRASANISAHSVYALKLINEAINQSMNPPKHPSTSPPIHQLAILHYSTNP